MGIGSPLSNFDISADNGLDGLTGTLSKAVTGSF
jgi:hypothetical protein